MRQMVVIIALTVAFGVGLAVGSAALADRSQAAPNGYGKQIAKLQWDVQRLKRAEGNLCVFFRHAPNVNDLALAGWFRQVAIGCNTFGVG